MAMYIVQYIPFVGNETLTTITATKPIHSQTLFKISSFILIAFLQWLINTRKLHFLTLLVCSFTQMFVSVSRACCCTFRPKRVFNVFFYAILFCVGICLMLYIHFFNFVFYSRIVHVHISVLCWDFSFKFFRIHNKLWKSHKFFIIKLELWHAEGLQGFAKINSSNVCRIYKFSPELTEEAQICVCIRMWYAIVLLSVNRRLRKPNNRYDCSFVPNHMNHSFSNRSNENLQRLIAATFTIIIAGRRHFFYRHCFRSGKCLLSIVQFWQLFENWQSCLVFNDEKLFYVVFFFSNIKGKCSHEYRKIPSGNRAFCCCWMLCMHFSH